MVANTKNDIKNTETFSRPAFHSDHRAADGGRGRGDTGPGGARTAGGGARRGHRGARAAGPHIRGWLIVRKNGSDSYLYWFWSAVLGSEFPHTSQDAGSYCCKKIAFKAL